jgi:hypothetical protein
MKTNYSETLEKTMRVKSGDLNRRSSRLYERAHDVGLTEMLRSDSLHRFAELAAGVKLRRKCGRQVICYEAGDYVGPHNDHHPEDRSLRRGYIDVHLMFSNQYVKTQLLIYEQDGYLVNVFEMNVPSAMAIYRLPFWHYTTPLVAKSGMERLARRWLLLASFEFETTRDGTSGL